MSNHLTTAILKNEVDIRRDAFYRHLLGVLNDAGLPYVVGGAYAFHYYTNIGRNTKDLDLFIRRQDYPRVSEVLQQAGYQTELTYPHWLAKVRQDGELVDIIFSSGNGLSEVDDVWFEHAPEAEVLGMPVRMSPVEEMIWSKAFVMERERYDGADVAHLIKAYADRMDWQRLFRRFEPCWRVLLSHFVLFGFIYPADRHLIPRVLMEELITRLQRELHEAPPDTDVCAGTLLSREQYLIDVERAGYQDARVVPHGNMTVAETAIWTDAIQHKPDSH